ncbi:DUF7426 family protein [Streptosporangium canum]|uniref:DUF7426 family protein n=1 Tax=Streptosporangium canum TaxID=324952 RepID=UPI0037A74768
MAAFKDLDEFFDDTLRLPVGGKTYVIPAPDAEVGLLCQRLMNAGIAAESGEEVDGEELTNLAAVVLTDDQEQDLYKRILGPVYVELFNDGLTWPKIQHIGSTALIWVAVGTDAAVKFWTSSGEAQAPNRSTRRATAAAARSTRSRGSATGTTRTTASRSKAVAKSPGTTS